jgi:hypothetical protein
MKIQKYSVVFLAISLAVIFWNIEALIHSLIFNKGSFLQQLIPHDPNELWMRLLIFFLIIVFGIYANFQIIKVDKSRKEKEIIQKRLEEALAKTLSGYITICANCKKIQKEDSNPEMQQSWQQIESYISKISEAQFSHSICPECGLKLYGDIL